MGQYSTFCGQYCVCTYEFVVALFYNAVNQIEEFNDQFSSYIFTGHLIGKLLRINFNQKVNKNESALT